MRNFLYYLLNGSMDVKKMVIKGLLPKMAAAQLFFYRYHHRFIDVKNPKTLDEKLLLLQLRYNSSELASRCTDKYMVREYIREQGYEHLLNGLLGVYDRAADIKWSELPDRFALKCNHGSGFNLIVKDKGSFDMAAAGKKLDSWLLDDYGVMKGEPHYSRIKPRIIAEEFLEDSKGNFPPDYKFFCSKGRVIGCLVITGRGKTRKRADEAGGQSISESALERVFVNENFEDTHFINEFTGDNLSGLCPESYKDMLKVAAKLSEPFPFVRVDLYDKNGQVIFGELTFTPHSCIHPHINQEGQLYIGERIDME